MNCIPVESHESTVRLNYEHPGRCIVLPGAGGFLGNIIFNGISL